jgi:hypothetical protein
MMRWRRRKKEGGKKDGRAQVWRLYMDEVDGCLLTDWKSHSVLHVAGSGREVPTWY